MIFSAATIPIAATYFIGGVVMKKLQGRSGPDDWLPHHHFWSSLYGLVIDGVGFVVHGRKRILVEPDEALIPKPEPRAASMSLQSTRPRNPEPTKAQEPLFTEVIEKYGDENQQQLKDELEQQGTTAARLGLKQLETLVLKQQLEKLGLPTTGTKADLQARMRQATELPVPSTGTARRPGV